MRLQRCLLVLFLLALGCQTHNAATTPFVTLKIYHTNDIHSHYSPNMEGRGGLAYLASVLKVVRAQDKDALILDAGDFYKKGSLPAQKSHDESTAEILSHMPYYDVRVVGNNEVKVGIERLLNWSRKKEPAPLISANFVDKDSKPVFPPYILLKKNGLNVGIVGITFPFQIDANVQPDPHHDPRAPYKILEPQDVLAPLIKNLRPRVDVLILLSHQIFADNVKLARKFPQIDLVVSGHNHIVTPEQKILGGPMVVESGQYGEQIGVVTLVYDRGNRKVASLESTFWPVGPEMQIPDPQVQGLVKAAYQKWAPDSFEVLARAEGSLTMISPKNPYEGSLHDWAADSFCQATGCDVGVVNRDMLRESIPRGNITKEALFLASPYEDSISTLQMSKSRFIQIFSRSIMKAFNGNHMVEWAFNKAKLSLTLEPTGPVEGAEGAVSAGQKLKKISISLESPKDPLTVALPDYVVNHCADFFQLRDCPLPKAQKVAEVREVLEKRLKTLKHVVPPPADRVKVLESGDSLPPPSVDDSAPDDSGGPDDLSND